MTRHVAIVIGTRPEAVKLMPVALACAQSQGLRVSIVSTGQHREMLRQVLALWDRTVDVDLDVMQPRQDLTDITTSVLLRMRGALSALAPDVVVLQGDTTTTFAGALAAFYQRVPVAHVEAGLRTGDRWSPYPEEANRLLTARLADIHFAPTVRARQNLLNEGIPDSRVIVTGNTGIDALLYVRDRLAEAAVCRELRERYSFVDDQRPLILVTAHRRESFGAGFEEICEGIRAIARENPEVRIVYPVHLNPNVREPVDRILADGRYGDRIHLIEPVGYQDLAYLLSRAKLVLTDSGGIQEEAPALGKPVLVMRTVTERPEAVESGGAILVGADRKRIAQSARELLTNSSHYARMAVPRFPYGDGTASKKIAAYLATTDFLSRH